MFWRNVQSTTVVFIYPGLSKNRFQGCKRLKASDQYRGDIGTKQSNPNIIKTLKQN